MQKLNKNAAQPGINQGSIKSLQIILPSENIIKKFDDIITPLFGKVFVLAKQAELLKIARNKLLPKLMSGEIEV
jgi:type I restriction enzyme S subunit